jgi:mono/diheme cytochrome c family protein
MNFHLSCLVIVAVLMGHLVLLSACGSARRAEPITGRAPIMSGELLEGKKLFMKHCDQCHPRGEAGLAPAINNKPHPAFLIKFQVRQGLGAMPSFSKEDISDEELEKIVSYLQALRNHL